MALSRELGQKLNNTLMDLFRKGFAPTRKQIVDRMKQVDDCGEARSNPRLDLDIAG